MLLSPSVSKTGWQKVHRKQRRLEVEEGWRDWMSKRSGRRCSDKVMGEKKRLAPQSCVVAVQARTERSTCYKQLGARVVIAVGVHCIGEGMNIWEVTPPRLIVILKGILEGKWAKTLHMYTNYSLTDHSSLLDLEKTKKQNCIPASLFP